MKDFFIVFHYLILLINFFYKEEFYFMHLKDQKPDLQKI